MKDIAVFGAGGFIGSSLCKMLIEEEACLYAFVQNKEKFLQRMGNIQYDRLHIIEMDMNNYKDIGKMAPCIRWDEVYYLSWYGGIEKQSLSDHNVQLKNLEIFIDFMKEMMALKPIKIIFVGTDRKCKYHQDGLEDIVDSLYGTIKNCCELIGKNMSYQEGILFNSIDFSNVFGVGDYSNRSANSIIKKMVLNESIDLIPADTPYDWTYIDDAVEGLLKVARQGKQYSTYYVGSEIIQPFSSIMDQVKEIVKSDSKLNYGKYRDDYIVNYQKLNPKKLYQDTDFTIREEFATKILKTVNWIKNQLMK